MKFMIQRYRLREEPLVSTEKSGRVPRVLTPEQFILSSLTSYSLGFLILVIVK